MKKVTINQYEYGDHIRVVKGFFKGKIGTVMYHDLQGDVEDDDLTVRFDGEEYDTEYDAENIGDDEYDMLDGEYVGSSLVEPLTKKQYDEAVRKSNPHAVKGLPAKVYFTKTQLVIGDNPISKAEAIKFANNILTQLKGK